jgi:fructokinase
VPVVAVIGEALIDVMPTGDEGTFAAHVGGSPLNVAVGLARLEQPTAFLGRFSRDGFGRLLRRYADGAGLWLGAAPDAAEPSTLAVVALDDRGVARYDFTVDGTADWGWTPVELAAMPPEVSVVHCGSLASWMAPGAAVIGAFIDDLRARGEVIISYDPNVRPGLLADPPDARATIEPRVAAAHLVKASTEDLAWLYADTPPADVALCWLDLGAKLVIVTDGGDGTTAYRSGHAPLRRPAMDVDVVDTVGAGDAFTSGLLDALLRAGLTSPPDLDALGSATLTTLLDQATTVAGLACTRAGAKPPSRDELLQARRSATSA